MMDSLHKATSPETYDCNLCAITHGFFSTKKQWSKFLETVDVDVEFLHRDELTGMNLEDENLPLILSQDGSEYITVADAGQINQLKSIDDLIGIIQKYLS